MVIFITGGAKSGKSRFAEDYARHLGSKGIYVATAQQGDEEMRLKIRNHQLQREASGFPWETREIPYYLTEWLNEQKERQPSINHEHGPESGPESGGAEHGPQSGPESGGVEHEPQSGPETGGTGEATGQIVLVDCLTLWLSNWLLKLENDEQSSLKLEQAVQALAAAVKGYPSTLLLVSNEVGNGIVPEYRLGRQFRDCAGRMNQLLAAISDQAFLVTAGIPVELKKLAFHWDR